MRQPYSGQRVNCAMYYIDNPFISQYFMESHELIVLCLISWMVIEYRTVYRTRVLYEYTILSLVLDSISLKSLEIMKNFCSRMKTILF